MVFALSKLIWAWASPGSVLAFMLAIGLALAARPQVARLGKFLCGTASVCLLALAVLPVGEWALTPLENRFAFDPPAHVDGIIVIGGDEQTDITQLRGRPTALDSMRRYVTFLDLSRRYPQAKLIFSGGSGHLRPLSRVQDYEVARDIMQDIGVPTDRMTFEKTSRNTWENALFSAQMIHPEATQKWLLVTSAWHMTRAMGCFRRAGWNIYAAPTGYFTPGFFRLRPIFQFDQQTHMLTLAAHEYIGLAAYWLMGRTSALWPG